MYTKKIIGVGVDIESIQRFMDKPFAENEKFYIRLFTASEIEYCLAKREPYPHFTARFCAKEALKKALPGITSLGWTDVEIKNDENGMPFIDFLNLSKDDKTFLDECKTHISLSHDNAQAVALVIVEKT